MIDKDSVSVLTGARASAISLSCRSIADAEETVVCRSILEIFLKIIMF